MVKKYLPGILVLIVLIISYSFLLLISPETAARLSIEDGIIEYLGAVFYFFAACVLFYLFLITKSDKGIYFFKLRRNYFILFLGLFFLICAGEEISWGQRIFGIATPENIKEINAQGEINIHNLYIFHGTDKDKNIKSGLEHWLTGHKLFAFFWMFYCLIIPVLAKLFARFDILLKAVYFPLIPLWLSLLFLMNHLLSKVLENLEIFSTATPIVETKESIFALFFLIASVIFYLNYSRTQPRLVRKKAHTGNPD